MSIKASLSSDGLEEVYTPPTLKEMCLYKCLTNKEILTKEVEVDEDMDGSEKLEWERFRLKEPIQRELVEALLDAGENFLFALTPTYEPVLAAIRMSQPEHLVKVHVSNSRRLTDNQLEWLISGGNVKSLDINGCIKLRRGSLDAINKFGSKLEYLRIGDSCRILPDPDEISQGLAILRTPNVKTFIFSKNDYFNFSNLRNYWTCLLHDFVSKLEDLQIRSINGLETLEFLEPARSTLSSLTLRDCKVAPNANAWASLFNLDKLRFLDLIGSSIEAALGGENVVQRLLTAMPDLTHLAVDSGLLNDVDLDTSIPGQGSVAKRLEFLAIRNFKNEDEDASEVEVRRAKLLANDVADFWTFEGGMRMLEYYSNLLNIRDFHITVELEILLQSMNMIAPCKTVAVVGLLMKIFKNHGADAFYSYPLLQELKELFTPDVVSKLGTVLVDQCIGTILALTSRWSVDGYEVDNEPYFIGDLVDVMMKLEGELRFDHYVTIVSSVMNMEKADIARAKSDLVDIRNINVVRYMQFFKDAIEKTAGILKKAVDVFPGEINELWGISTVLVVIKGLKEFMVSHESYRVDLLEAFSSLITSLRKLCLTSVPRRVAFHSANGVGVVMNLLKEIIDGSLGFADRDSFALLAILKSILEDTNLKLSESGMISSGLEKFLLSVNSQWEFWKPADSDRETTHYFQLESIADVLNFMESDPRYDYNASAAVKEIQMKLR